MIDNTAVNDPEMDEMPSDLKLSKSRASYFVRGTYCLVPEAFRLAV